MSLFTAKEYRRYVRHIQLPQVGANGQLKLKEAHIVIVGCGGLGAPVSLYLAAAGIGKITLIDGDAVELSNLQRQITFSEQAIGLNKAQQTGERIRAINSDITVIAIDQHLDSSNADAIVGNADLILDCSDNFATRHLINRTCKRLAKPWIYASVFQFSGQCAAFNPHKHCYQCIYPRQPEQAIDCNSNGVLGTLPGLVGTLQANQAINYLLQLDKDIDSYLLMIETLDWQLQKIQLQVSNQCPLCGDEALTNDNASANKDNYANNNTSANNDAHSVTYRALQQLNVDDFQLIDVRSIDEHIAYNVGGMHFPLEDLIEQIDRAESQLDRQKLQIIYCHSGARSEIAAKIFRERGFDARSLDGGLLSIQ